MNSPRFVSLFLLVACGLACGKPTQGELREMMVQRGIRESDVIVKDCYIRNKGRGGHMGMLLILPNGIPGAKILSVMHPHFPIYSNLYNNFSSDYPIVKETVERWKPADCKPDKIFSWSADNGGKTYAVFLCTNEFVLVFQDP